MKQIAYLLSFLAFLLIGALIGRNFQQYQAFAIAKEDARNCFNGGLIQKNNAKESYFLWPQANKLPTGFEYPEEPKEDIQLVIGKSSDEILFFVRPIYNLDKYVVTYRNGIVSVYEGELPATGSTR